MAGKLWTRDETLVAFNLYCELAQALGRTPDSLAMKCCKTKPASIMTMLNQFGDQAFRLPDRWRPSSEGLAWRLNQ